ncbi:Lead, cadmium, zinc and mercury transporting ATPase [Minicystis rosea]|nr:Lead, cadmium, zinc and mercury transporting ATPase [Minicystis rosea]
MHWLEVKRSRHAPRLRRGDEARGGEGNADAEAPARLRLEVAGLFGDEARARRIERRLRGIPGVREARASARTGRVLITLDAGYADAEARAVVADESDALGPEAPSARRIAMRSLRAAAGVAKALLAEGRRKNGDAVELEPGPAALAFHALDAADVAAELAVDPAVGLSATEAEQRARTQGRNVLAGIEPRSAVAIVAGQVFTVPTAVLGAASGLSLLLGDVLEAVAISAVVGSNVAIGYFTEQRAEELLHAWGELRAERARVLRGGREITIDAADVVPGDVLVLRAGEAVAADARVLRASELSADESTLTGESEPAEKTLDAVPDGATVADRSCMVFAGTVIAGGTGAAIVTATGERTELGAIRRSLAAASDRVAPLERQLDALGKRLAGAAVLSAGAIVPLGILRGRGARELVRSAVALGVAVIPEGIPTAGTTALALASRKLFRRGIVIRRLAAAETLGAVSAVCADKTGTLTWNRMRVEEIFLPRDGAIAVTWSQDGAHMELERADGRAPDPHAVRDLARVLALNADVEIDAEGAIKRATGTERALVEVAIAAGFPVAGARKRARRVREQRRSAERSFMVTVHDDPELGRIELVKGAPEQVVELCHLPAEKAAELLSRNETMGDHGLRVLAAAWRPKVAHDGRPYTFLGLVGLRDPPRAGVREAIAALARAGVRTYMVTGDQERTAKAIAASLGIDEDAVYSRVTPEAKVDVVRELQERGRVVAMTGDGVNDGPALKAADVGIAMGQRGTDIARAVADVVLSRDDLPAIAEAVAEGRRLYDNVRRAIDYLVATNMSEVMVMIVGALGRESPLSPLQLLWLNMLTDTVPALALAVEPAEPGVMERPPRDPQAELFGPHEYRRLGRASVGMAGVSLGALAIGGALRGAGASPSAMAFTSLITAQLLHTQACRASTAAENPLLRRALLGSFALQLGALSFGPVRAALGVGGTPAGLLALAAAMGAIPTAIRRAREGFAVDEIVITRADARSVLVAGDEAQPRTNHEEKEMVR